MHITVVPASPRTAQAAIRNLLADPSGPTVRGVYRNLSRVPAEFASNPRFTAVKGDIEDSESLDLSGSDAVFNVQPPIYEPIDTVERARVVSGNVKAAIARAGSVKRLVYVSSMGAQYDHGLGEILTNHAAEVVFADAAPEVVFVRCGYFMENWAAALETLPEAGFFFTTITPVDYEMPHIASQDIGKACAQELLGAGTPLPSRPYAFDLVGPKGYSSLDVQRAWEEALGKKVEMRVVERDGVADFYAAVFPPEVAARMAEMNLGILSGGVLAENSKPTGEERRGTTELVEVFKQLLGSA